MTANAVPKGWSLRTLAECGRFVSGGTPTTSKAEYWDGPVPWISAKSLKTFDLSDSEDKLTQLGLENGPELVPAGTVLFVVRGMSLANEFRVGVTTRPVAFNQDLKGLVPGADVDARYLARYLRHAQERILTLADSASHGTRRVPMDRLEQFPIPLPALSEQQRIAAILDKADTIRWMRGDAITDLALLPRSLFRDMFGDPTQNARGWPVVRVEEAGEVQLGRQRSPKYQTGQHTRPYIRVANVFEDFLALDDLLSMDFDEDDFRRYRLSHGDILLNEGQSTELVGRPAIWQDEIENCCFQNTLIRFRADRSKTDPEYALGVFLEYLRGGAFSRISSKTSNVAHLGAARFAVMPFPLPPLDYQQRYGEYRRKLRELACQADSRQRAEDELFQSIVQRAFRGDV